MNMRPKDLIIVSRRINFEPPQMEHKQDWHRDGAVTGHFINAFQTMFPAGEGAFIDAARDCSTKYVSVVDNDHILKSDLALFIEQEGRHSVAHDKWSKVLISAGYDEVSLFSNRMIRFRKWVRTHLSIKTRLAITVAGEHYTASLVRILACEKPRWLLSVVPPFQGLFLYHTMEELEHKSVSFDLYKKVHGGYGRRLFGLAYISVFLWVRVVRLHRHLLRTDNKWGRRQKKEFWEFYVGNKGILQLLLPRMIEFLRPSFEPWQYDERKNFEESFGALRTSLGIEGFQYP